MWCISQSPGLAVKLRSEDVVYAPNGNIVKRLPKLKAWFRPGYFPDWAWELAKERWPSPPGQPDQALVPKNFYGGFETRTAAIEYGWSEEDLAFVEDKLLNDRRSGIDWFVAEEPKLPAPWQGYDKAMGGRRGGFAHENSTAQVIALLTAQTGTDPATVIAYERQNKNREEVIAALEALVDEQADAIGELIQA